MLEVCLLGKFEVRLDDQTLEIPLRPAQALLAHLILTAGTSHRREKLAGLLWPDFKESTARSNLRQTLWRLRKAVGDEYFLADKVSIAFDANANYELDVSALKDPSVERASSDELIRVVSVYQGRLLPGFYDEWVLLEQERLEAIFTDRMQLLLDRLTQEERWREVSKWAEGWIALGQVPEPAYRALMIAHAELGNQASVAAVYQRCVETLHDELGVEPSQDTRALYERLSKGERPSRVGVDTAERGHASHLTDRPDLPSLPPAFLDREKKPLEVEPTVFIGREQELSRLDGFLKNTFTGRGQVVFVTGEAGRGKTSLLNEFARRAQEAQPKLIVVSGICDVYTGVGDPYLPFRDVLSMLTADIESQWAVGTITRDHALRLWHLLPHSVQALLDYGPGLIDTLISGGALVSRAEAYTPDGSDWLGRLQELLARQATLSGAQGRDQSRIFEEYIEVLEALAARQPLLLILDDLHWADLSSISLLGHLGRRIVESPILIVGAYRAEDVAQGRDGGQHPLEDILGEFKRNFGNIWIELERNEPTRGRAFVDVLLDSEPNRLGEDFRQELARRTEGHPLFTVELLRDMQERGDLQQDVEGRWVEGQDLGWDTLPARVEGVIEKRIGRLDSELREALTVASVEGEEFTAEVVAWVREVDERTLVRRLSTELDRQHRLVKEQGSQRLEPGGQRLSRYRFRHNLFQKYLYNSLGQVERSYQHEAVGIGLEALYRDRVEEIAVQLARHFQEAGLMSKAIDYLRKAGDVAARVYANAEAIASYDQALNLARQSEVSSETLGHLYTSLGRVLELESKFDEALANYEEMERMAQQRKDRPMALFALVHQSQIRCTVNALFDPEQGETLAEKALTLAQELGDREAEAKILRNQLNLYKWTNKMAQAIDFGERSLALARELNLREQIAFTLNDLASTYPDFDRILTVSREASDLWRELGNLPMLTDSLGTVCYMYAYVGDYEAAVALSDEAFQISQTINNVWGQSFSRYMVGLVYWNRGEPDRAIEVMEESIHLGEQAGFLVPGVTTRAYLASVYGDLGAIEYSIEIAHKAAAWAKAHFSLKFWPFTLAWLAQLQLLKGDVTEAAAIFQRADDASDSLEVWYVQLLTWIRSQLALAQGEYNQALVLATECLTGLRQNNFRIFIPDVLYLQGQALLSMNQPVEAYERWVEARAEAEALGSRRTLWKILAALSEIEAHRGNPTEAESLRQQARKVVEFIADHAPTSELRASFLNLPQVRAVFEPITND